MFGTVRPAESRSGTWETIPLGPITTSLRCNTQVSTFQWRHNTSK